METKKLHQLIRGYKALNDKIKEAEAQLKEELKPDKEKLLRAQAKLQTVIHKDNDEGLGSVKIASAGITAYSRYEDKYKIKDRDHLIEDYILEGVPDKIAKLLRPRLAIFGSSILKDPCIDHRLDTGAEEIDGRLVGGELLPGVGMHTVKDVRIVKS